MKKNPIFDKKCLSAMLLLGAAAMPYTTRSAVVFLAGRFLPSVF
ncbi:hypothetical protein [Candidatus Spyradosoma sp. SGI.093]